MNAQWTIGIIGGSGLYAIDGLADAEWREVATPWGTPSDRILYGRVGDVAIRFLPRHGRGHVHLPGDIPVQANIDALKRAGCTDLLAISSVGSLREELAPGTFAIVDQFVDRTTARAASFFGRGLVAHVSLADPTCARLSACRRRGCGGGRHGRAARHVSGDGGTAILDAGRIPSLPLLGFERHRHDQHARGQARA